MAKSRQLSKLLGLILGGLFMIAACYSVFLHDWKTEAPASPEVVRPLKTLVVEGPFTSGSRVFPGRVKAARQVDLAFELSGAITELPINKGDAVSQGQVLAQLDARDFQNALDAAKAEVKRAESHLARIREAIKTDAVSQQDLSNAEADYETARAQLNIKQKAVDDTRLIAPFNGTVADRFVENHTRVSAKQAILRLQDISALEIEVNIPEAMMALAKDQADEVTIRAAFDFLPDQGFELRFKETRAEADPTTQSYLVTFLMQQVEGVNILPGMSAKVRVGWKNPDAQEGRPLSIPMDVLLITADKRYAVWKIEEGEGACTVHRQEVEVGGLSGDSASIEQGLEAGDRIAAAGIHLLKEGQRVRLIADEGTGGRAQ